VTIADTAKEMLSNPFSQSRILSSWRFAQFLEERGSWITEEGLETLEKEGLLRPLFRLRHVKQQDHFQGVLISNDTLPSYLAEGLIEFPKSGDFKPWSTFKKGFETSVSLYYHPAQALVIDRFLHAVTFTLWGPSLRDSPADTIEVLAKHYYQFKDVCHKSLPILEAKIGLLMLLETPYAPSYRQRISLGLTGDSEAERWSAWRRTFRPEDIIEKTGMQIDDIVRWRNALALEAIHFDPLGKWFLLVRCAKYGKRAQLRGDALRAQDYYEHVSLLNMFLKDLTGQPQPEPDDIADASDHSWKRKIYGPDFDINTLESQKKIIDEYFQRARLITKLLLIVEGDTEETCIPPLCHAMNWAFEVDGELVTLHGVGGLNNLRSLLEAVKQDKVVPFVIVDDDPGARRSIDDLLGRGLLDKSNVRVWKRNFEEDNFTLDTILGAVNEILREDGQLLSRSEIEPSNQSRTVWDSLEKAFYLKYRISIKEKISKPDFARRLIQPRLAEIRKEVKENKYKPKLEIEEALFDAWTRIFHSAIF
jgi:hypothetical protein